MINYNLEHGHVVAFNIPQFMIEKLNTKFDLNSSKGTAKELFLSIVFAGVNTSIFSLKSSSSPPTFSFFVSPIFYFLNWESSLVFFTYSKLLFNLHSSSFYMNS